MNIGQIENFEKAQAQLEGLHSEMSKLSKSKPNDALNKFKLKFINQVLEETNKILGERYKPFPDFYIFDDDELPNTSDITFIISQYLGCMENLRVDNIERGVLNRWIWNDSKRETYPPLKLKR